MEIKSMWILLAIAPFFLGSCYRASSLTPAASPSPPELKSQSPVATASSPSPTAQRSGHNAAADTWARLRQGKGYVVLFRHALAPGTGDPANFQLDDCATQRNLSAEGRQQAVRLGETLRRQNISVARVLSSQWCRCLETARLMNIGAVEPFPALNSFFRDRSTERSQTQQLRQFILENRLNPAVVIMVTHQVNITAISNIIPASGAGVVMQASPAQQVELIGQLNPP